MKLFIILVIIAAIVIVGCTETIVSQPKIIDDGGAEAPDRQIIDEGGMVMDDANADDPEPAANPVVSPDWREIQLTDVATGTTFKISDFKGKPILLESFAVWCPTCTKQQRVLQDLHAELGDSVVSISLDTDPNEDVAKVKSHVERNGFDWLYAVAPESLTRLLIDDFGVSIVNAPGAPVVLICEDQSARFLKRGVKDVDELKLEIAQC